jgi:hypothetical protein
MEEEKMIDDNLKHYQVEILESDPPWVLMHSV